MTPLLFRRPAVAIYLALAVSLILFHGHGLLHLQLERSSRTTPASTCGRQTDFPWELLLPNEELIWVSCYTAHQCARLIVPLNYSEPDGKSAVIALVRYPSALPPESPSYRGPILFNPGGPGGSGVDLVVLGGYILSAIVGPQFDIVGFDPRGIGRSTPRASFFKTNAERALWGAIGLDLLNSTTDALPHAWARAQIIGKLAEERDNDFLAHINTDNTARDMLRITQSHGRERIQFWGFSYGSVLGATFAAMFPDKIERLVIDGVMDADDYYATLWSNNLLDTDKVLQSFFDGCVAAGPEICPFYAPTSDAISQKLTALYNSVRARPVPVRTPMSYGLVDYARLKLTVFVSLYSPYVMFTPLAHALADLADGDGTTLFQLFERPSFECSCDSPESAFEVVQDGQIAVICTDGNEVDDSLEELKEQYENMAKSTEWAEIWAGIRLRCSGWPKQAKNHFQGPFVANTSFPILLVGNVADPVTPLASAHKTSKGFPGSVVLTQNSTGHCSMAAPSICTPQHIRRYFVDGILPEIGTLCPVIGQPFPGTVQPEDQTRMESTLDVADRNLVNAIQEFSYSFRIPFPL